MPPVVGLIIGIGLAAAGTTAAVTGAIVGIGVGIGTAVSLIVSGASMILGGAIGLATSPPKLGSSSSLLQQGNTVSVKQSAANRVVVVGRAVVAGVYSYLATTGASNEYLHIVATYAGHEVDAIEAIYFDQYTLVLDVSGNETSQYAGGFVFVETKLGAPGEAAFPGLVSDTSGLGAAAWDSSCRQDGCCSIHFKLKWDQGKFPNGVPNIRVKLRGKKVVDPRTGTRAWSNNLACIVRDWLLDPVFGLKCATSEIDDTLMIAAANLADEAVSLAAGGTEPRYTCNGSFDTSRTRGVVIQSLLSAGAGKLGWLGGLWSLYLGAWRTSSLSIGDNDFRAGLQLTSKVSRRSLFNGVKGQFVDPNNDWQTVAFPAMVRSAYVADDSGYPNCVDRGNWATAISYLLNDAVMSNGYAYVCTSAHTSGASTQPGVGASWPTKWVLATEMNWKTVEYPFTTSPATAQRLAKIDLEMGRRQIQLAAPCKLGAYLVQPPDVVAVTHANFVWTNKTFEVSQCDLTPQDDGAWGVDLILAETDSNIYSWTSAFENTMSGVVTPVVADPKAPGLPTSLGLQSGSATVLTRVDGIKLSRILATWTAPADQFVQSGGKIYGEYQVHGSGTWVPAFEVDGAATSAYIQGVSDGVAYDVRIKSKNVYDVYSATVEVDNHIVSGVGSNFTGSVNGDAASAVQDGANRARQAIDTGFVAVAAAVDFTRSYANKNVDNVPDGPTFFRSRSGATLPADIPYNGGFEVFSDTATVADGWTSAFETTGSGSTVARSASPFSGSYAQSISNNGASGGFAIASRPFGVKPNVRYTFRCRAKSTAANPGTMYFRVCWYSNDDDLTRGSASLISTADIVAAGGPTVSNTYQLFSAELLAPSTAVFARIALYNWIGTVCTITFDTVSVRPTTISLADGAVGGNLDNLPDGTTYGKPLGARLSSGKPWIDFSEAIHSNKNLDNVPNGTRAAWDSTTQKNAAVDSSGNLKLKNIAYGPGSTSGPSISCTTSGGSGHNGPATIPELTQTITTSGNKVFVSFAMTVQARFTGGTYSGGGVSIRMLFFVARDNLTLGSAFELQWGNQNSAVQPEPTLVPVSISVIDTGASAGTHTYDAQWRIDITTPTDTVTGELDAWATERIFQVVELG